MSSKTSFRRFFLAHDTPRPMDQLARKNSLSKRNLNMSPLRIFRTERPCDADSFKNQKCCMTSFILIFYRDVDIFSLENAFEGYYIRSR